MGVAPHSGVARGGASFELDRLELVEGRLVVRGWWLGVRGVRFVRPELVADGQRVLATLEHKPWVAGPDGAWIASFPWKRELDVTGVMLIVGPSVEVPLDRDLVEPEVVPIDRGRAKTKVALDRGPIEPKPSRDRGPALDRRSVHAELPLDRGPSGVVPAAPGTVVEEVYPTLRNELDGVERKLDEMHEELREARAQAAAREARCRELEGVVARERSAARKAEEADEESVRAHAMAVLDRDRALAQAAEAVNDREAAVRARTRMERQCEEALAACDAAEARRDTALAERDEARRQRDEILLAVEALRAQLKGEWVEAERAEVTSPPANRPAREVLPDAPQRPARTRAGEMLADAPREPAPTHAGGDEAPLGVRKIPAARMIAGSLHRSRRERERRSDVGVTTVDLWAMRILGSITAVSFITLLVMILKAFFVF